MQESNAELSEKSGMLQAEKKLLEEDIKRWKARTQVRSLCVSCGVALKKYLFVINENFWVVTFLLAPGEPAEGHWPRRVQAAALWEGSPSQTHPAACRGD